MASNQRSLQNMSNHQHYRSPSHSNHAAPRQEGSRSHFPRRTIGREFPSLTYLCRQVISTNLERYPAEAFSILDESEWGHLVETRYVRTRPLRGSGGLDGSGRRAPAIHHKFMQSVEEALPHLAESKVADEKIWKDNCNHIFPKDGVSRPNGMTLPWPLLVKKIELHAAILKAMHPGGPHYTTNLEDTACQQELDGAIEAFIELPMNVELLKQTGIGKIVKKVIKHGPPIINQPFPDDLAYRVNYLPNATPKLLLQSILQYWMTLAANDGVQIEDGDRKPAAALPAGNNNDPNNVESYLSPDKNKGIDEVMDCLTWRQLFVKLQDYNERRKEDQGARIRERRQKLDEVRPKIVKVRPARPQHAAILARPTQRKSSSSSWSSSTSSGSVSSGASKMQALRAEAMVTSTRRRPPPPPTRVKGGFGDAVAFASGKKRKAAPVPTKTVALAGGKRMKVPDTQKAPPNLQKRINLFKKLKRPPPGR